MKKKSSDRSRPDQRRTNGKASTASAEKGHVQPTASESGVQAQDVSPDPAAEVEKLQAELADMTDKWKRQAAEFQNYRRRTEQEKASMVTFGKTLVVQQLLDVIDDFERSLETAARSVGEDEVKTNEACKALMSGLDLVYQKLMSELEKLGVRPIHAVGEPFDEELHEAMLQQPAGDGEKPGIVLSELQKGYKMGDRVLRHSRVVVSS